MTPDSTVPSDTKTCVKCGRTGTRQFKAEGDGWVCVSEWSCQGRVAEANAKPPSQATCHKCGRVGVRDFLFDAKAQAPKCSNWGACSDRQREAGFKETAEDLNTAGSVQVNVNAVPSDTDRLAEIRRRLGMAKMASANAPGTFWHTFTEDTEFLLSLVDSLQGRLDTAEGQLRELASLQDRIPDDQNGDWGLGWDSGYNSALSDVRDIATAALCSDHEFLPVNGHPDDDECTHRSDGTDDTYCGATEDAHGLGEGDGQ